MSLPDSYSLTKPFHSIIDIVTSLEETIQIKGTNAGV